MIHVVHWLEVDGTRKLVTRKLVHKINDKRSFVVKIYCAKKIIVEIFRPGEITP